MLYKKETNIFYYSDYELILIGRNMFLKVVVLNIMSSFLCTEVLALKKTINLSVYFPFLAHLKQPMSI